MGKRNSGLDIDGILLLDKRLGVSSNRALQEVKRQFNANKAGHTGSLDPLATGLLPICLGEATKVSSFLLDNDKRYQVTIQLGVITDTGDAEGNVVSSQTAPKLNTEQLAACIENFTGELDQVPPMYSALKFKGRKLYELAREGKSVERQSRRITLYQLVYLAYTEGLLTLDVHCSKGTYIRSLAEDIGAYLGCGGTVVKLRRTAVGRFSLADAQTLEKLREMDRQELSACLIAVDKPLLSIPEVILSDAQAGCIRQGQKLHIAESIQGMVRMYSRQGFLGLGEMLLDGKLAPKKLFRIHNAKELN